MGEVAEINISGDPEIVTAIMGAQEKLFGGFDAVEEYELSITGATGLEGDEDLAIGQEVELVVRGIVREVSHQIRDLPEKKGGGEILVRVAKIKATGARVKRGR